MLEIYAIKKQNGNVLLQDKEGNVKCEINKDYSNKPTKRNKYVMYNCYKYKLIWIK